MKDRAIPPSCADKFSFVTCEVHLRCWTFIWHSLRWRRRVRHVHHGHLLRIAIYMWNNSSRTKAKLSQIIVRQIIVMLWQSLFIPRRCQTKTRLFRCASIVDDLAQWKHLQRFGCAVFMESQRNSGRVELELNSGWMALVRPLRERKFPVYAYFVFRTLASRMIQLVFGQRREATLAFCT